MSILNKHVVWKKLDGKLNPSMMEQSGFGVLTLLELGERMVISGDNGLSTSRVVKMELFGNDIKVNTLNSTYYVGLAREE